MFDSQAEIGEEEIENITDSTLLAPEQLKELIIHRNRLVKQSEALTKANVDLDSKNQQMRATLEQELSAEQKEIT